MQLLDGKKVSTLITAELKQKIEQLKKTRPPKLAVIMVGDDYASHLYVKNKVKACQSVGIATAVLAFNHDVPQAELIKQIERLNQDANVDGILVQLPLSPNLDELQIINTIAASKDVDGLTNINLGKLLQGDPSAIIPCTVKGIIKLLDYYHIPVANQNITIINNSNIVGKPLAMLLNNMQGSVSMVHKNTKDLNPFLKNADIICTATGVYNLFTKEQVQDNVVIIDIAINKLKDKKVVGDIDFDNLKTKAKAITPVPGGVGPMTIAMLLDNLMTIYQKKQTK